MIFKIIFIIALVAIDQYSKILAVEYLIDGTTLSVIPNILGLRYSENTGAAFSILSNNTNFLIIATSIGLVFLFYLMTKSKEVDKVQQWLIALAIGGGIGNLIDRVRLGYVVDYFEVLFMDFAIFNVADSFVCIAVFLGFVYTFYDEIIKKKGENK